MMLPLVQLSVSVAAMNATGGLVPGSTNLGGFGGSGGGGLSPLGRAPLEPCGADLGQVEAVILPVHRKHVLNDAERQLEWKEGCEGGMGSDAIRVESGYEDAYLAALVA